MAINKITDKAAAALQADGYVLVTQSVTENGVTRQDVRRAPSGDFFAAGGAGTALVSGQDLKTLQPGGYYCGSASMARQLVDAPLNGSFRLLVTPRTNTTNYVNLTAWGNDGLIYTAVNNLNNPPESLQWTSTGRFAELTQLVDGLSAQVDALAATVAGKTQTDFDTVRKNVNRGWGRAFYPVGSELSCWKAFGATAAAGAMNTGVTGATVDFEVWLTAVDKIDPAPRVFKYTGSKWQLNGTDATLADWGITATGTPAAGDTITVTMDCVELVWRVVAHDHHQTTDNAEHTMTLEMKYAFGTSTVQKRTGFDAKEAFYTVEGEAQPAGTYTFRLNETYAQWAEGDYSFTTTQSHPVGAQLCISSTHNTALTSLRVHIYNSYRESAISEYCNITAGASGTALGAFGAELNELSRISVGSGNYAQSNIRQWLNSSAAQGQVLTQQTKYDRPAAWETEDDAAYAGFLHGMDKAFVNALGTAIVPCIANAQFEINSLDGTVFTPNTEYNVEDKVFLLSRPEVYGTNEISSMNDGELLEYYNGAANTDLIPYDAFGTVRPAYIRTPRRAIAGGIRYIMASGELGSSSPFTAYSIFPAVVIGGAGSAE